jgi:NADH:ubiquinone oxidoreductase subunit F (NADH-binding)
MVLKYLERRGENQFVWGQVTETLKTNNQNTLLKVEPPVPVSSGVFGLPNNVVAEVDKLWCSIMVLFLFNLFADKTYIQSTP